MRANRRDIRIDVFVETVRLRFLNAPDRTPFGVRPHSDTTLRIRNATTLRLLKDGTRTHSEGPPRAGSSGNDPKTRNLNATEKLPRRLERPHPGFVFRERSENSRHIQATRRHDSVRAVVFALTVSASQRNQRLPAARELWTMFRDKHLIRCDRADRAQERQHAAPVP